MFDGYWHLSILYSYSKDREREKRVCSVRTCANNLCTTPVYKKDDPLDKVNYRPVTVLTSVDKVFEQMLCRQLKKSESILDTFMSAYRSKYGCETRLIRLVEDWKGALDLNKAVAVLSTDMSKAFDSMYPPLLIAKLESYGVSKPSYSLLKSYLEGRESRGSWKHYQ